VQHDRHMAGAVLADIAGAEPFRHVEIELQRAALPSRGQRIAQYELEFWPVKRASPGFSV